MTTRNAYRFLLALILLILLSTSVAAQFPRMTTYVTWTPDRQLTSITGDDRYVTMDLFVSGNVQYWAVNITCNIGNGQQLTPVRASDNTPTNDPDVFVNWGADWGTEDTDFVDFGTYNPAIGQLNAVATRVGASNTPLGSSGVDSTELLYRVKFRVNSLTFNTQVFVNCFINEFLDRNGNVAFRGFQTRTPNLFIYTGYTLRGKALRQGATNHSAIEVTCINYPNGIGQPAGNSYVTNTDFAGNFRFDAITVGGNLRDFGMYECTFRSKLSGTYDTQFLEPSVILNLTTPDYYMLPVYVRPGDYNAPAGTIDASDITRITSNWNTFQSIFVNGDANGDTRVNNRDLTLVAANVGLGDGITSHLVYGLGRDFDTRFTYPNSKIWWGTPESGGVTPLINFTATRDFWPQVSPDGTQVAFIGVDNFSGQRRLWIGDTIFGRAVLSSPFNGLPWQLLAPSWSPDGNRLAMVCSTDGTSSGYVVNEGNLCIQQSGDRISSTLNVIQLSGRRLKTKIFPPAWLNESVIIYAGHADDPVCANTLCFYDIQNSHVGAVEGVQVLANGSDRADMPIITHYNNQSYLAYRFYDSGATTYTLRMAELTYDSDTQTFSGGVDVVAGANNTHVIVNNSAGVDYYAVSPDLDILFYQLDALNFYQLSGEPATNWTLTNTFAVDAMIGNPNYLTADFGGSAVLWDGDITKPTPLHAERMTFDWIP